VFFVALALLGALWLSYFHDPQVRREALQGQQDQTDNKTIARLAAESFQRESTFRRERDSTARVIANLRSRVLPRDTIAIKDTNPVFYRQLAVRDSLIAALDARHVQDSLQILFYRGQAVAYRDSLAPALQRARDTWKKAAQQPRHTVTDIAGGVALGYGLAEDNPTAAGVGAALIVAPRVVHLLGKIF
jgi:hypothetical protein